MADFQSQAMGLTGLTIDASSTAPSRTEFSQFLNDGVIDVTSRCLRLRPQDIESFTRESSEQTSNGFNPGTRSIVSVIRESGTNNQWYPCAKKPIGLQYRVTDPESLHFASKYSPVYMITQDRNVHVYPEPSADGDDTFKVLYVNYSPEESDGTALDHASTGIKYFPNDKVYLVVLYASIQSLMARITSLNSALPSDITLPTVPIVPTLTTTIINKAGLIAPTFVPPIMSVPDFGDTDNWISTEEDSEMLAARIQEIQTKIGEYSARMAEAQAQFNKENIEFQADLQITIQNAQIESAEDGTKLQKYGVEVQEYTAEVGSKVQEFTTSLQKDQADYQWTTAQYASLKAQYNEAFIAMAPPAPPQQPQQRVAQRRR